MLYKGISALDLASDAFEKAKPEKQIELINNWYGAQMQLFVAEGVVQRRRTP